MDHPRIWLVLTSTAASNQLFLGLLAAEMRGVVLVPAVATLFLLRTSAKVQLKFLSSFLLVPQPWNLISTMDKLVEIMKERGRGLVAEGAARLTAVPFTFAKGRSC
jgi:hypothetical protein